MDGSAILWLTVLAIVVIGVIAAISEQNKVDKMSTEELARYRAEQAATRERLAFGDVRPQMICPHCQTQGQVRTKQVTQKKGISGTKATAAVLTAGVSVLATGLSRKEGATQAHCGNCSATWFF